MNEAGTERKADRHEAHPPVAEQLLLDAAGVGILLGISLLRFHRREGRYPETLEEARPESQGAEQSALQNFRVVGCYGLRHSWVSAHGFASQHDEVPAASAQAIARCPHETTASPASRP